jgi:hypothetical protein
VGLRWTRSVSGHDFSRADDNGWIKGFSRCRAAIRGSGYYLLD